MLLLNVLRELRQSIGSINEYEFEEASLQLDDGTIRDLSGTITFLRTDRGLLATVMADGRLDAECSRCLKPTEANIHVDFKEEYVPVTDADTGSPVRIEDDETFRINRRFDLDLREGLRQYILISEPAKPLCKLACAGLCPACGEDLNLGLHECEEDVDERWSALAVLRNDTQEGNYGGSSPEEKDISST